jgi:hypothetical protein
MGFKHNPLLYYAAGTTEIDAARLRELGLTQQAYPPEFWNAPPVEKFTPTQAQVANGPDGAAGRIFTLGPDDRGMIYRADDQEWKRFAVKAGALWIGWWRGQRPHPEDLARPEMMRGTLVELGDGHTWRVPVAMLAPQIAEIGEDGRWQRRPDPKYHGLFELAERLQADFWEAIIAAMEIVDERDQKYGNRFDEWDADFAMRWRAVLDAAHAAQEALNLNDVVSVLAHNYRVGPREGSALGLIRTAESWLSDTAFDIVNATVNGPGILLARAGEAADKKKQRDSGP